jgi:hypothetical protein
VGGDAGIIAMKTQYLVPIALAALAAGIGWTAYSFRSDDYCPQPSAANVATLFAPCQAFDTAMGHPVTKQDGVQMGLLDPDGRPAATPRKQTAPTPGQLVADDFQAIAKEHSTVGVARFKQQR